ncbi:fic/DOC family protein [Mycena latifolia]|nr:fic/DOC family protein [Mycena latifolia]
MATTLASVVAHQSVAFEDNPLTIGDTSNMRDRLFGKIEIPLSNLLQALGLVSLPPQEELLSNKDPNAVADFFIGLCPTDLHDIQIMSSMLLRGTLAEKLYEKARGTKLPLGEFRNMPIRVRSHPLAISPYPDEVPALMERLLLWRQETRALATLHPLIFVARYETYFTAIHPFLESNGRIGRFLAGFYLVQNGFLSTSYHNLDRQGYLHAVGEVHDGRPDFLC